VHIMTNTALTGATYDIDGGQQLVSGGWSWTTCWSWPSRVTAACGAGSSSPGSGWRARSRGPAGTPPGSRTGRPELARPAVTYPDSIVAHTRRQTYYFDLP